MHTVFEWNEDKNSTNVQKHRVDFETAQYAFFDPARVIAKDLIHSGNEERFYCFGKVKGGVLTVRFTYRVDRIRIIGAGFWRRGKAIYEEQNQVHK